MFTNISNPAGRKGSLRIGTGPVGPASGVQLALIFLTLVLRRPGVGAAHAAAKQDVKKKETAMGLVMNVFGASGIFADGSIQPGAPGARDAAGRPREALSDGVVGRTGGAAEAAPASAGGNASANGLTRTETVQASERKEAAPSAARRDAAAPFIAGDAAASDDPASGLAAETGEAERTGAGGSRDLFFKSLVESFAGGAETARAGGTDPQSRTEAATDGEAVSGLALTRFNFQLYGSSAS